MTNPTRPALQAFEAMEVLAAAQKLEAEGRQIIHLELGEPGAPAAPEVREAARTAVDRPQRYTQAKGIPALREALAGYYRTRHGVEVDPDRIVATQGSSAGFMLAFLSAFNPGDRIALTRPGYPAYFNIIRAMGLEPVEIPVMAADRWHLTAERLLATHEETPFEGLLFASPANPTGATVGKAEFAALIGACAARGVRFISDEIYHGLEFGPQAPSALELTGDAIIINSFSKFHCMTGWRIGWMVLPEELVRPVEILGQNLFISASSLSQTAAVAALSNRQYGEAQRAHNLVNRDLLIAGLTRAGFDGVQTPDGAFYAYVDVAQFAIPSRDFCLRLLQEAGVAATPGTDFDKTGGGRYVRFSFAGPRADIEEAVRRIGSFASGLA